MHTYKLEEIEWTNIWREEADKEDKPRVLLIGDSITQGYSSFVYRALDKKWSVTHLATSKCIDNPWLLEEIILLGKQEKYDYVHFNNGIHGYSISDNEIYREFYRNAVRTLRENFPGAKLSVATSTILCNLIDGKMEFAKFNETIIRRNEIVYEIAAEFGLQVDDLYAVAVNNIQYLSGDGVHYKAEGYQLLGKTVADFLMQL